MIAPELGSLGAGPAPELVLVAELIEVEGEDRRAGRVHRPDESELGVEPDSPATLVPEIPDDDRRPALVAGDRLGGHLQEIRDQLRGLVRTRPVMVVEPTREADRRLLDHEHPDLVAGVEEVRARRVVRGPDDVDVGLAQVDDILTHVLGRQRPALQDPRIVAVDAADPDRRPVDEELVAPCLDPPKPDSPAVALGGAAVGPALGPDDHLELVQTRLLRRPRLDRQRLGDELLALARCAIDRPAPTRLVNHVTRAIAHGHIESIGSIGRVEVDRVHAEAEHPRALLRIPVRVDVELSEVERRRLEQEDVAPDAEQRHVRIPAHVVEDGVRRELGQRDGQGVSRRPEKRADLDIERGRPAAVHTGK